MALLVLTLVAILGLVAWRLAQRPFQIPPQYIAMNPKRWAELLDLQRRQDDR
jgi:hypothetical protein